MEFFAADHKRTGCFAGYHDEVVVIRGVVISVPEIKGEKVSCIVRTDSIKRPAKPILPVLTER